MAVRAAPTMVAVRLVQRPWIRFPIWSCQDSNPDLLIRTTRQGSMWVPGWWFTRHWAVVLLYLPVVRLGRAFKPWPCGSPEISRTRVPAKDVGALECARLLSEFFGLGFLRQLVGPPLKVVGMEVRDCDAVQGGPVLVERSEFRQGRGLLRPGFPVLTASDVPVVLGALLLAQSFDEALYSRLVHFWRAVLLFDHVKLSLQGGGADSGSVDAVSLAVQPFVQLVRDADVSPGHDPSFTREASRLAAVCIVRNIPTNTHEG